MTIEDRLAAIESDVRFLVGLSNQPADPRALNTLLPSASEPQVSTGSGLRPQCVGDGSVGVTAGL